MKSIFTLFCVLILNISLLESQIIYQENFEGGSVPAEWAIQSAATDGGWKVGTPGSLSSQFFNIQSNGSTYIAGTNDDACNCDKSDEYFITPPLDFSAVTAVALKFDAFYTDDAYQGNQEDATIEASTDGVTWEVLEDLHGHGSWDRHSINLSNYAGEDTVYIGFRYDDGGGWLYGFAIDNVVVEVPPALDGEIARLNSQIYGEVNKNLPIKGTIYNGGSEAITSLEISYTIDGGGEVSEQIDNLNIPAFDYYNFELVNSWVPDAAGMFTVEVEITSVNGQTDENEDNNTDAFDTEIFDEVIVPDKIEDFLTSLPVLTEITEAASSLDLPTDLDFFPILGKNELWVVNQRNESSGGSTLTISDATTDPSDFWHRVDGNAWHFMSLPTGIAFSDENFNFATSPGVKDANHGGGTFTGPTLWSSHPDIYAQPSGGNGSHLDMLHGSPYSMGIAHEVDNVFWVYDDWNKDIVRYDFVEDHGPGNDDHADAIVRRYQNLGIDADGDIPNHMVLDKTTGWLYFVDNGNDRVLRLDINSGGVANSLPLINEPLAEHSAMGGFTYEVIIDTGLDRPCGIEVFENRLLVGDYATGDIIVYDITNNFAELGRIPTLEAGLTGIKIGPDGNIWCTNRIESTLTMIEPGEPTSTFEISKVPQINISPNPSTGLISINIPSLENGENISIFIGNTAGKRLQSWNITNNIHQLDLSHLPTGVYFLNIQGDLFNSSKKIIINK